MTEPATPADTAARLAEIWNKLDDAQKVAALEFLAEEQRVWSTWRLVAPGEEPAVQVRSELAAEIRFDAGKRLDRRAMKVVYETLRRSKGREYAEFRRRAEEELANYYAAKSPLNPKRSWLVRLIRFIAKATGSRPHG